MLTSMWGALAQAGSYDIRWRTAWVVWCALAMAGIVVTALVWWGRESGVFRGGGRHGAAHA